MRQPTVELADIVGALGNDFIVRNRSWLTWPQVRVLLAIQRCRTAALGGHLDGCSRCGHQAISYNSCLMGSICKWRVNDSLSLLYQRVAL